MTNKQKVKLLQRVLKRLVKQHADTEKSWVWSFSILSICEAIACYDKYAGYRNLTTEFGIRRPQPGNYSGYWWPMNSKGNKARIRVVTNAIKRLSK